ncbi:MAG: holo-ACP synthase [Actinomycetota bacterium]|nr:holo-ACP synthase [Actinomycetota bacterium]
MIVGVGIDVVPVERFEKALTRTPRMRAKLFTAGEQRSASGRARHVESLAARFAAKEALAKALGAPGGLAWTDAEVHADRNGDPRLEISGTVAARAAALGVTRLHLSISHDGGIASAVVIAESEPSS